MSTVNVWVALSDAAFNAVRARLNTPEDEYQGPVTDTEAVIFRRMADFVAVNSMFLTPTIGGKKWHLFSLNFEASATAKTALDWVAANHPSDFVIGGAWNWDGSQVTNGQGTALYPPHPRLTDFMPNGVLADINLIQGQAPRDFGP